MNGKQKCEILKSIRRDIAKKNDIALEIPPCTHTGDCPGSCPRCESEVRYLERALDERKKRGLKVALAGISAGLVAVSATACEPIDTLLGRSVQGNMIDPLEGDVPYTETDIAGEIAPPEEHLRIEGDLRLGDDGNCEIETDGEPVDVTKLAGVLPVEKFELQGDIPPEGLK